jgi:hypothetical protein
VCAERKAMAAIALAFAAAMAVTADLRAADEKGGEAPAARAIEAKIFYSSQDPNWGKVSEMVARIIAKRGDSVKIETLDIEKAENYRQLARIEKELSIDPTGDITAVIGTFALTSRGDRRDVEKYFEASIEAMLKPRKGPVHGNLYAFARETFGQSVQAITPDGPGVAFAVFRPANDGRHEAVGWVEEINSIVDCPVCADVAFMVAFDAYGKVVSIRPLREVEKYGKPMDASPFLAQFRNRRPEGRWTVGADIQGITGATKTARLYVNGIKEAAAHFQLYRMAHQEKYRDLPPEPDAASRGASGGAAPEKK